MGKILMIFEDLLPHASIQHYAAMALFLHLLRSLRNRFLDITTGGNLQKG
jgi:hypothetical protein